MAVSGFDPGTAARLGTYVYLLVDPQTGRPFYAGRGRKDRCFRHVAAARNATGPAAPPGHADGGVDVPQTGDDPPDGGGPRPGRFPQLDRIRAIEAAGREVRIDVLRWGMSPSEALLVEAAVRDALGLHGPDHVDPRTFLAPARVVASALDARLARPVRIKRQHPVVLLRQPPGSHGSLAGPWRVGRRWTDPGAPRSPRWALGVDDGRVVAAARIERWDDAGGGRFLLAAVPDPSIADRYVGRSVAAYLAPGASLAYVWCGPHWVNAPG
ncbi:MAG: GIY-YIG nuclease family protein [Actinomycetota bacterium]|nr:GIY-YIG nuclease family protein [Actinomycetota bacterium]